MRLFAVSLFAVAMHAAVVDPAGDFLPTYAGAQNGDLDVISAEVLVDPGAGKVTFNGTMAGPIGTTPGALYVWGLDRGSGTERFVGGTPSIGQGIPFDMVVILRPDTTATVNDFINAQVNNFAAGTATISGNTLSAMFDLSLFPGTGFDVPNYTWNLWPRVGAGSNTQLSDFAPDASNAAVQVVPEPGTMLGLFTGAAALALARLRRRR